MVLLFQGSTTLSAQTIPGEGEPPPSEGALFLLLPVGAKGVGLGRAMTALGGAEGAWWNPAGLGEVDHSVIQVYRGDHPLAGEATALSGVLRWGSVGTLGTSYQLMDLGSFDVTDVEGNVIGTLSGRNHLYVLSFARRLRGMLSLGANVKVAQSRFTCRGQCTDGGVSSTSVAFDAGAQLSDLPWAPLRLGLMIAHVQSGGQGGSEPRDPLPTRIRLAGAYELLGYFIESEELSLLLAMEVEDRWRGAGSPATYVGAEFAAGEEDLLYVRAGYVFGAEQQVDGAAVGVGLRYERFQLGLAKSLATSALPGETEPVHISFGVIFR